MSRRPNVLFLMTDQMQSQVLEADSPCRTPALDALAARGLRVRGAYTSNAICSPARASLMTGMLPHNHGVLTVTHTMDKDQNRLRREHAHWSQRLREAGYRTGYFGKWHVEQDNALEDFGWQVNGCMGGAHWQQFSEVKQDNPLGPLKHHLRGPDGYVDVLLYGAGQRSIEERHDGVALAAAEAYLREQLASEGDDPWCCFVSLTDPHDPYVCSEATLADYDIDGIPLPASLDDDCSQVPELYRRCQQVFAHLDERQHREATACYFGAITEIDRAYGRLIEQVAAAGQLDNTIVVFTSDHGDCIGAHGLYCKNVGAYEETYRIPLIISGPGVGAGQVVDARIGLHDLGPTICELCGVAAMGATDGRSAAGLCADAGLAGDFQRGYAEYLGGRIMYTQRIVYDGPWKFVYSPFAVDELYDLGSDPHELRNLAAEPAYTERLEQMYGLLWENARRSGDHSLVNSAYPPLRLGRYGPGPRIPVP